MTIHVALAIRDRMLREALCSVLRQETGIDVVGEAPTPKDVRAVVMQRRPDVLIVEVASMDDAMLLVQIAKSRHYTRTLAFSQHADVACMRELLRAGASGIVTPNCSWQAFLEAIRSASRNQPSLSADASDALVRLAQKGGALDGLTSRERDVLTLIADGQKPVDVASALGISLSTVQVHRRNLMHKLNVRSTAELTRVAVREGMSAL